MFDALLMCVCEIFTEADEGFWTECPLKDLSEGLYESFCLNFTSPLSRSVLEELAALVAKDDTDGLIDQARLHPTMLTPF
jgi:hypothetical protein